MKSALENQPPGDTGFCFVHEKQVNRDSLKMKCVVPER